jgi:hypothetical protein
MAPERFALEAIQTLNGYKLETVHEYAHSIGEGSHFQWEIAYSSRQF